MSIVQGVAIAFLALYFWLYSYELTLVERPNLEPQPGDRWTLDRAELRFPSVRNVIICVGLIVLPWAAQLGLDKRSLIFQALGSLGLFVLLHPVSLPGALIWRPGDAKRGTSHRARIASRVLLMSAPFVLLAWFASSALSPWHRQLDVVAWVPRLRFFTNEGARTSLIGQAAWLMIYAFALFRIVLPPLVGRLKHPAADPADPPSAQRRCSLQSVRDPCYLIFGALALICAMPAVGYANELSGALIHGHAQMFLALALGPFGSLALSAIRLPAPP